MWLNTILLIAKLKLEWYKIFLVNLINSYIELWAELPYELDWWEQFEFMNAVKSNLWDVLSVVKNPFLSALRLSGSACHKAGQMFIFSKINTFLYTAMLILTEQRSDNPASIRMPGNRILHMFNLCSYWVHSH